MKLNKTVQIIIIVGSAAILLVAAWKALPYILLIGAAALVITWVAPKTKPA